MEKGIPVQSVIEGKTGIGTAPFKGGHFGVKSEIAHVRFKTRDLKGKKVLTVEEMQSDFAIRAAINAPIQGSAADIIKKAMIKIYKFFNKNKVKSKLILQVHDELLFEMPESEITYLTKEITNIMEKAILPDVILNVPLVVDVGKGDNWAEAH